MRCDPGPTVSSLLCPHPQALTLHRRWQHRSILEHVTGCVYLRANSNRIGSCLRCCCVRSTWQADVRVVKWRGMYWLLGWRKPHTMTNIFPPYTQASIVLPHTLADRVLPPTIKKKHIATWYVILTNFFYLIHWAIYFYLKQRPI